MCGVGCGAVGARPAGPAARASGSFYLLTGSHCRVAVRRLLTVTHDSIGYARGRRRDAERTGCRSAPGERPGVNLGLTAAADRARPGSSTATPGTARGHPADIADRGLHGRNAPVDRAAGPDRPDADRGLPSCGLRPTCYRYAQYPEPGGCTGSRTVAVLSVAVGAAQRCRSGVLHIRCSIPAPRRVPRLRRAAGCGARSRPRSRPRRVSRDAPTTDTGNTRGTLH